MKIRVSLELERYLEVSEFFDSCVWRKKMSEAEKRSFFLYKFWSLLQML